MAGKMIEILLDRKCVLSISLHGRSLTTAVRRPFDIPSSIYSTVTTVWSNKCQAKSTKALSKIQVTLVHALCGNVSDHFLHTGAQMETYYAMDQ